MTGPYSVAAQDYFDAGWSPIPLPFKTKWPPADGFTGARGEYVDAKRLKLWLGTKGRASAGNMTWKSAEGNVALRLHPNFIGIDVDMYDDKAGRETFHRAIEAWGALPATWYASSRSDGSGIRLFRIPEGLAWPGKLPQGGGVELVRWDHRYVVCAPSIHDKTGQPYAWFHDDRGLVSDEIPEWDEIPALPEAWVEGLTSGKQWTARATADMDTEAVRDWLSARNGGKPCTTMRRTLSGALRTVRTAGDDGGAHDAGRDGAWALIGDAAAGHGGVESALKSLRKAFVEAIKERRGHDGDRLAAEEWARIVVRGVQKVAAEGEADEDDLCAMLGSGSAPPPDGGQSVGGSDDHEGDSGGARKSTGRLKLFDYTRDDIGNAQRLVHAHRHDLRWVAGLGGWVAWNGSRWCLDVDGTVSRWAMAVVRDMESEASEIEDPKERAAFMKFIRSSGNIGKLRAMVSLAAEQKDISVAAEAFDADPALLGTPSGTVKLVEGRVERVPAQQEHMLTRSTRTPYVPDARSDLWDKFLLRVQPDEEIRTWLQKLVGYSLLGGNPQRLFIAVFGPTSTGKTTFMEAVRSALGDYGDTTNLTLFRDNQDERARADVVEALDTRFLFAEEASHEWKLHPDQIKRITGGTAMKARRPFAKEYVRKVPGFTPWLVTNSAPHIEGADPAFMRRLLVVPFMNQIDKREEVSGYRDELVSSEEARCAVLAWCIAGWEAYSLDPDLATPANAFVARAEFQDELSDFDSMLTELCETGDRLREKPSALFQAYLRWCETNGVSGKDRLTGNAFGRALSARGYRKTSVRVEGKPIPCRAGLRLKKEWAAIVPDAFPQKQEP